MADVVELAPGERALREVLGGESFQVEREELIKRGVHRVTAQHRDAPVAFVLKHVARSVARRLAAVERWLAEAGLAQVGCPALGAIPADDDGVWLVFPDLGGRTVRTHPPVREEVVATIAGVAALHRSFAGHHLLEECRREGGDLGRSFVGESVAEAIDAVAGVLALASGAAGPARLLERLEGLRAELPDRVAVVEECGGPATLLHGDLWPSNSVIVETGGGVVARLIDWDGCGTGPPAYDLSAFLLRFPSRERRWILDAYQAAMRGGPWAELPDHAYNAMFDTFERARLASCATGAAHGVLEGHPEWGVGLLTEIDTWLETLEPVLAE